MLERTNRDKEFASLRARYDAAFAMLAHACRELYCHNSDDRAAEELERLRNAVDLSQEAYRRARNEFAAALIERRARQIRGVPGVAGLHFTAAAERCVVN